MNVQASERWMDYDRAASYMNVSTTTVKGWVSAKMIPYAKMGSSNRAKVLLDRSDLDAFIESHKVKAI